MRMEQGFCEEMPGIYRLRVPFEGIYTSVFLVTSEEGAILVDCATTAEDVDIRRELFSRLAKRDWPLLSSKSLAMSLEDIFIHITLKENGGNR